MKKYIDLGAETVAIINEVQDTVSHWADFAAAAGVSEEMKRKIGENIMRDVTE